MRDRKMLNVQVGDDELQRAFEETRRRLAEADSATEGDTRRRQILQKVSYLIPPEAK